MLSMTLTWHRPPGGKLGTPNQPEQSYFPWAEHQGKITKCIDSHSLRLAELLKWPPETFAILKLAFRNGLSRRTCWDLGGIDANLHPAFSYAQGLFKRGGIGSLKNTNLKAWSPLSSVSGTCHIEVETGSRSQDFSAIIDSLNADSNASRDVFTLVDEKVAQIYADAFAELSSPIFKITPLESRKTWAQVEDILLQWKRMKSPKHWIVVGGGITLDLGMFAAGLVGAGVTLLPTSLLAMCDAAIGGKTGINYFPYGKNQVGTFYFPERIIVLPEFLHSLPFREIRSGGAECLKQGILHLDECLLERMSLYLQHDNRVELGNLLFDLIKMKTDIVVNDPFEASELRQSLNLGHTLAHALESLAQEKQARTPISHGEAVAVGLAYDILVSQHKKFLPTKTCQNFIKILAQSKTLLSKLDLAAFLGLNNSEELTSVFGLFSPILLQDKKNTGVTTEFSKISWIVPSKKNDAAPFFTHTGLSFEEASHIWRYMLDHVLSD